MGLGMAYLKEITDTSYKSPDEIEEELQIPVLVSMPFLYTKTEKRDKRMKNMLMAVSVSAGFAMFAIGIVLAKERINIALDHFKTFF